MENKLDKLLKSPPTAPRTVDREEHMDESGKPYTITIEKMSSANPEVREGVNPVRCLQDLGFPARSSIDEVSSKRYLLILSLFIFNS